MDRNVLLANQGTEVFTKRERGGVFTKGDKEQLKEVIAGGFDAIVDESLTEEERKQLCPLDRFHVDVWPISKQHRAEGHFEKDGFSIIVAHATTLEMASVPIPLRKGQTTESQRFESTREMALKTMCRLDFGRVLPTSENRQNDVTVKFTCFRKEKGQADFVTLELPRTGLDNKNPQIRIYVRGSQKGKLELISGSLERVIANANSLLDLGMEWAKVEKGDEEHLLEIAAKIRNMVFG